METSAIQILESMLAERIKERNSLAQERESLLAQVSETDAGIKWLNTYVVALEDAIERVGLDHVSTAVGTTNGNGKHANGKARTIQIGGFVLKPDSYAARARDFMREHPGRLSTSELCVALSIEDNRDNRSAIAYALRRHANQSRYFAEPERGYFELVPEPAHQSDDELQLKN